MTKQYIHHTLISKKYSLLRWEMFQLKLPNTLPSLAWEIYIYVCMKVHTAIFQCCGKQKAITAKGLEAATRWSAGWLWTLTLIEELV